MSGSRGLALALLAAALLAAPAAGEVSILLTSPVSEEPVFGTVVIAADVYAPAGVERVELFVDGKKVGELDEPPWRLAVDVGEDNREHRFEARVVGVGGEVDEALLVTPPFRIDDEIDAALHQLYITVTAGGRRVLDLEPEDFVILDDGDRQDQVTFSRGDLRISAVLLLDASASMRGGRLAAALGGAQAFLSGLRADDQASIAVFSDRLLHATPFSGDAAILTAGLAEVAAAGGTALADHLYYALKLLEAEQGRRVVVLLSDGVDSHSSLPMEAVTWLAQRSRSLLYWIRTDPRDREAMRFSAWKDPALYRAEYERLTRLVAESGGRVITLGRIEEAEGAFAELMRELREQYVIGYYPSNKRKDGSWHRVQVRLTRPGLALRAPAGYVDD